jgi:hypothetical protein
VRDEVRREVIGRDMGPDGGRPCTFHQMETILYGAGIITGRYVSGCNAWTTVDVHEVKTRARGGSIYDLDNCVALCRPAHDWVTDHDVAAEALGLVLPSWATDAHEDEAWRLRNRRRLVAYRLHAPSWREDDARWLAIARRDLEALWGPDIFA